MAVVRPFSLLLLYAALVVFVVVPTASAQVSSKPSAARVMTAMAATATPDPSLVAAYSFDDVSGSSATDDSGNGNLGTVAGASVVPGHSGSALSFNGTSSSVTVADNPALDLSNGMTVEAWVEPTAAQGTARRMIVGKEGPGELAYGLYSNTGTSTPAGGLSLNGGGAGETIARGPTQLPVGSWSHLAVTYDGAMVHLYVNGVDVADTADTTGIDVTSGALRIGGNSVLGEYFNGLVDDVRVYSRALAASEIQNDMSTPVPVPVQSTPGLVAAYSFDDVSGSSATDDSGTGNAGTISGASVVPGHAGSALSFNGTSSWLTVPDSSSLDLSSAMTLEAWVEPTAAQGTTRRFIVGKEGSGELAYGLYSNTGMSTPAGGLSLSGGGAGEQIARGPSQLPVGSWSHIAVTYDGSTVRLYVNGSDVADAAATGPIDATSGALRIGGNSVLGEYFNGLIDDVRAYNRALAPSDIQTDMNTPVNPSPSQTDKTPPTTPAGVTKTGATATTVSISWSASSDNVGVAGYGVYKGTANIGSTTSTSYTFTGLTCGTSYTLGVDAYDAAGNRSAQSSITASTSACADMQAPTTPSGVTKSGATTTSISLSWSASTDNVGVAGYGLYRNGANVATATSTSYTFSGLTCGTSYTLAVDAYDASGNRSAQSAITASTSACPDTQAPATPAGLTAGGATQTSVSLSWSASTDNVGVTGYTVYKNGTALATTTATSYAVTGLTCGTSYTLAVDAFDAAGNHSAKASTTAATSACPAPAGLFLSPSGSDSSPCTQSAPCWSMDRAYHMAQPGQTVQMAGGNYGDQTITGDSSKTSSADVVFQPAPGASVTLRSLHVGGQHMTIQNITITINFNIDVGASHVTLRNFSAAVFGMRSSSYISLIGGSMGPWDANKLAPMEDNQIGDWDQTLPQPTNILIDGVTFHDYTNNYDPSAHIDCLQFMAGINVTIRNSRFVNCMGVDDVFIKGDFGPIKNFLIENNFFGYASLFTVRLSGQTSPRPCDGVLVRYNSSLQRMWSDCNATGAGIRFTSNINQEQDDYHCSTSTQYGATWDHNVDETGIPCGPGDVVGTVNYKDRASLDLHLLPGSIAFNRGDPSSFPATDIDGQTRPMGTGPDAGADEAG